MALDEAFRSVITSIAIPYGYTLAVWSSGALTIQRYGGFTAKDILAFVTGAVGAYLLLDLSLLTTGAPVSDTSRSVPSIALFNIVPMVSAVFIALLVKRLPSRSMSFGVTGFAATFVYSLVLTLLVWVWQGRG